MLPIHTPACIDAVLESVKDGVMFVAPDGTIRQVNRAMEWITGFSREELQGSPCTVLGCDACQVLQGEAEGAWCMLFLREQVRDRRCTFTRKDGGLVSAVKTAKLIRDEKDRVVGALEVVQDLSDLEERDRIILELNRKVKGPGGFCGMVGESPAMERLFELLEKAARIDTNILIYGESGTGKELVVDALHRLSHRREGPLVKINCSALTATLVESELFGHVKGAFTGALQHRRGHFEEADGGVLFLDEIGDMPLPAQVKLLRAVENREVVRVGGSQPQAVDVRILAATHRDLADSVRRGEFREDLYYRLNVFPIPVPPLRDRREDIALLASAFLEELSALQKDPKPERISPEVMELLMRHDWPGNVRELRSVLEYAAVLSDSTLLEVRHLPESYQRRWRESAAPSASAPAEWEEKRELVEALRRTGGNQTRAAKLLGVHRMTVFNRMRKYGIAARRVLGTSSDA